MSSEYDVAGEPMPTFATYETASFVTEKEVARFSRSSCCCSSPSAIACSFACQMSKIRAARARSMSGSFPFEILNLTDMGRVTEASGTGAAQEETARKTETRSEAELNIVSRRVSDRVIDRVSCSRRPSSLKLPAFYRRVAYPLFICPTADGGHKGNLRTETRASDWTGIAF